MEEIESSVIAENTTSNYFDFYHDFSSAEKLLTEKRTLCHFNSRLWVGYHNLLRIHAFTLTTSKNHIFLSKRWLPRTSEIPRKESLAFFFFYRNPNNKFMFFLARGGFHVPQKYLGKNLLLFSFFDTINNKDNLTTSADSVCRLVSQGYLKPHFTVNYILLKHFQNGGVVNEF